MRKRFALLALPLLLSCQDFDTGPNTSSLGRPNAAIIDGANGGNPHFFWRNPQWTHTGGFSGTPTTSLFPTVKVCRWTGTACAGADVATFKLSDGSLQVRDDDYVADWATNTASPQLGELFRVRVFLGQFEIGARDLKFLNKKDYGNTRHNNPDYAPIHLDPSANGNNGKYTFRFRLEEGVLLEAAGGSDDCVDCVEGSVDADGNQQVVIETPSEKAAAVFEPGSVPEDVNVLIERLPTPCLPTDLQQYPACYRFVTIPDVNFSGDVTVEVCLEQLDNYAVGQVQLHRVEEQQVNGEWVPVGTVTPLENVADQFIDCDPPVVIGALSRKFPTLGRGLRAVSKPLAMVLGPKFAFAEDEGRGGRTDSFSRVGWARGVEMHEVSGDNQSAPVGSALNPAVVSVTPRHYHDDDEAAPPAASVPLAYSLSGPNGPTGISGNVSTNANGQASVPVTLGQAGGVYTLIVTAPGTNITNLPVPVATFTFTATSGSIHGKIVNALSGTALNGATVELRAGANNTAGSALQTTTSAANGTYSFTGVGAGTFTVRASLNGYVSGSRTSTVTSGALNDQNIALVPDPAGNEIRIVLTWGQSPVDLDSHLLHTGSPAFHVAWYNTNPGQGANLDIDDVTSFGPETITITQLLGGPYTYFVHNWSGESPISTSGAQVNVFFGANQVATFTAPNQPGAYWKVFNIVNGQVIPVNTMSNSEPVGARPFVMGADEAFNTLLRDNAAHPKKNSRNTGRLK